MHCSRSKCVMLIRSHMLSEEIVSLPLQYSIEHVPPYLNILNIFWCFKRRSIADSSTQNFLCLSCWMRNIGTKQRRLTPYNTSFFSSVTPVVTKVKTSAVSLLNGRPCHEDVWGNRGEWPAQFSAALPLGNRSKYCALSEIESGLLIP
jgi:hypothetical protein